MIDLRCNAVPRYLYKSRRPVLVWRSSWRMGVWQWYRTTSRARVATRIVPRGLRLWGRGRPGQLVCYLKLVGTV